MLLMKRAYFEAIRAGRKTTTLRYWRWAHLRAGSVHSVPGLGAVRIDDVCRVNLASLRSADAKADGFASLAELKVALKQHYPPKERSGRQLYRIRFTFLPDSDRGGSRL